MKNTRLIMTIFAFSVLLFLSSCDDLLNVLVIQKGGGNYFVKRFFSFLFNGLLPLLPHLPH